MVSALVAILAEVRMPVPAFFGNFDDAILALPQVAPIGSDIQRLRIAAAQSDNRNRIALPPRHIPRLGRCTAQTVKTPARDRLALSSPRDNHPLPLFFPHPHPPPPPPPTPRH